MRAGNGAECRQLLRVLAVRVRQLLRRRRLQVRFLLVCRETLTAVPRGANLASNCDASWPRTTRRVASTAACSRSEMPSKPHPKKMPRAALARTAQKRAMFSLRCSLRCCALSTIAIVSALLATLLLSPTVQAQLVFVHRLRWPPCVRTSRCYEHPAEPQTQSLRLYRLQHPYGLQQLRSHRRRPTARWLSARWCTCAARWPIRPSKGSSSPRASMC